MNILLSALLADYPEQGTVKFGNFNENIQTALLELRQIEETFYSDRRAWDAFIDKLPFVEGSDLPTFIAEFVGTFQSKRDAAIEAYLQDFLKNEDSYTEVSPEDILQEEDVDSSSSYSFSPYSTNTKVVSTVSSRDDLFEEGAPRPLRHNFTKVKKTSGGPELTTSVFKTSAVAAKSEVSSSPGQMSVPIPPKPVFKLTPSTLRSTVNVGKDQLLGLLQNLIDEGILQVGVPTLVAPDNSDTPYVSSYDFKLKDVRSNNSGDLSFDFDMVPCEAVLSDEESNLSGLWKNAPDLPQEFGVRRKAPFNIKDFATLKLVQDGVVPPDMGEGDISALWSSEPDISAEFGTPSPLGVRTSSDDN